MGMKITCAAWLFLALGAISSAAGGTPQAQTDYDAKLLQGFAGALLIQHRVDYAFNTYVSDDLIQHNQVAKDGRAAAVALLAPIIAAPGAQFAVSTLMIDGDLGLLHYRGTLGGPGRAAAVAELYRIQGGKLVEHWDAFQPIPLTPVSSHPMFGALSGSLPTPCTDATPQDRAIVNGFADLLYRQRNVRAAFQRYAAHGMIQHDPGLPDGAAAAIAELTPILSRPATRITIAHILACRGMGVVHLRSQYGSSPGHVIFDIMRIDGGRIVEHWDVFQPVAPSGINPRPPA